MEGIQAIILLAVVIALALAAVIVFIRDLWLKAASKYIGRH